jgi:hypothetical protein
MLHAGLTALRNTVSQGGKVLFVGTKRQAQDIVREAAEVCGQSYINTRWLGGMLTNWKTVVNSIKKLKKLEADIANAEKFGFTKKEIAKMELDYKKLNKINFDVNYFKTIFGENKKINEKLDTIESKVDNTDSRLDNLESKLDDFITIFNSYENNKKEQRNINSNLNTNPQPNNTLLNRDILNRFLLSADRYYLCSTKEKEFHSNRKIGIIMFSLMLLIQFYFLLFPALPDRNRIGRVPT